LFGKLRSALSRAVSSLARSVREAAALREIKLSDIEDVMEEIKLELIEAEVAYDVAEEIVERLAGRLVGSKIPRSVKLEDHIRSVLAEVIYEVLGEGGLDIPEEARARCSPGGRPYVVVFLGVNGVGKTTSIAKIAYRAKRLGVTPVLAAADTFRAGAQEQLAYHAERLGVPIITGRYGSDPASVAYDAIEYAKARNHCLVLVDTAGRMHTDYDLMGELRKIVRVSKPDLRVLVVDALTGNDAVEQARMFNEGVGVDGVIITKADADVKGGAALSVAATIRKPILYLGVGQGYEDLEVFDAREFVKKIVWGNSSQEGKR